MTTELCVFGVPATFRKTAKCNSTLCALAAAYLNSIPIFFAMVLKSSSLLTFFIS